LVAEVVVQHRRGHARGSRDRAQRSRADPGPRKLRDRRVDQLPAQVGVPAARSPDLATNRLCGFSYGRHACKLIHYLIICKWRMEREIAGWLRPRSRATLDG